MFSRGDYVAKKTGDYAFVGTVQLDGDKRGGEWRCAVEDDRGTLHIFSEAHLRPATQAEIETFKSGAAVLEECKKLKIHLAIALSELKNGNATNNVPDLLEAMAAKLHSLCGSEEPYTTIIRVAQSRASSMRECIHALKLLGV